MTATQRIRRTRQIFAVICGAAAVLTAALALRLAFRAGERGVTVLGGTGDPSETVARFFHALCLRDWQRASAYVRGAPELDLGQAPEDALERDLWEAFLRSWTWSMGEGGRTDSVTAWQTVDFTCLRPDMVTDGIDGDVRRILGDWVDQTTELHDIYTEDGQFRPEVVQAALRQAMGERLASPERYTVTAPVRLQLIYEDGRWQILPEEALWNALSGIPEGGSA